MGKNCKSSIWIWFWSYYVKRKRRRRTGTRGGCLLQPNAAAHCRLLWAGAARTARGGCPPQRHTSIVRPKIHLSCKQEDSYPLRSAAVEELSMACSQWRKSSCLYDRSEIVFEGNHQIRARAELDVIRQEANCRFYSCAHFSVRIKCLFKVFRTFCIQQACP